MDITRIAVLAIIGAIFAVLLKENSPVFSMVMSVAITVVIVIFLIPKINEITTSFNSISDNININAVYIKTLVKAVAVSYIAMFSSQLCRDFGQGAIGDKVELAGKVIIMVMTAPLITELISDILRIF
jgi:stage III sporulation protein AD